MGFLLPLLAIVFGAASYVQSQKAIKKANALRDQIGQDDSLLINVQSNIAPIPVIYGTRRVGGTIVFLSTDGLEYESGGTTYYKTDYDYDTESYGETGYINPTNKYLYMALVLCEGEVNSITNIEIDEVPITDSIFSGKISYQTFTGSDSQAASTLLKTVNEQWTDNHKLSGVAYIALKFSHDPAVFSGIPKVTALVQGKKVYDPRTSTTGFSSNPALCIRDYLTNTRYGKGLSSSEIDDTLFGQAATDCEESVTEYTGGTTINLFECNTVIDTSISLFDNVKKMLSGCRGFLPFIQGQYGLIIDGSKSSSLTITEDEIIGGINIQSETSGTQYNQVTVRFANKELNYKMDTVTWPAAGSTEESTFLSADNNIVMNEEVEFETITSYYQARDLARVIVNRSRNGLRCSVRTTSEGLNVIPSDVVSVTHSTPGWSAKPFQVEEVVLNRDGSVTLQLLEYDSSIYTWDVDAAQDTYPDTNRANTYTVNPPTGLTVTESSSVNPDGSVNYKANVSWDDPADNAFLYITSWDVGYIRTSSPAETEYTTFTVTTPYVVAQNIAPATYTIRVRARNQAGAVSSYTSTSVVIDGKTDAPNVGTSLVATGGFQSIVLTWSLPADADVKYVDVYRNSTNNSGTATKIARVSGENFTDSGLADLTTFYYWIKTVDSSGNVSSFSTGANATTTAANITDPDHVFEFASDGVPIGSGFDATGYFLSTHNTACVSLFVEYDGTGKTPGDGLALAAVSNGGAAGVFVFDSAGSYGTSTSDSYLYACPNSTQIFSGGGDHAGTGSVETFRVETDGDALFAGDVTAYWSSDSRLKQNINPIKNSLQKVNQISGYTFEWNDKAKKTGHDVGVIAQEIEEILPEIVSRRDNGYLAVDYKRIIPLLIEAIKELDQKVEELKCQKSI